MASGILGQADLAATTNTTIYTVPADKVATFTVNLCNRTDTAIRVRLAVAATGTPGDSEWIGYDSSIPPNGVLERTGIVANATKNLVAYASAAGISVSAYGFED